MAYGQNTPSCDPLNVFIFPNFWVKAYQGIDNMKILKHSEC